MSARLSGANGIQIPTTLNTTPSTEYSISGWIFINALASGQNLHSLVMPNGEELSLLISPNLGNGPALQFLGSPDAVAFVNWGADIGTVGTVVTGAWHHFALTWVTASGTNPIFYWDGAPLTTTVLGATSWGAIPAGTSSYQVGYPPFGTNGLDGDIAEVSAWTRILTPTEVAALGNTSGASRPNELASQTGLVFVGNFETNFNTLPSGTATFLGTGTPTIVAAHPPLGSPPISGDPINETADGVGSAGGGQSIIDATGPPIANNDSQHFAWAVSLWCFDPSGPNQADVGNVMEDIAAAGTGITYRGAGEFASILNPSILPFSRYPPAASIVDNMPLGTSQMSGPGLVGNAGVIHDNNLNYPGGANFLVGWGDAAGAVTRIQDARTVATGMNDWFLLDAEADMDGETTLGGGGSPYTYATWLSTFQDRYSQANADLQRRINEGLATAGEPVRVNLIPLGRIWLMLLRSGGLLDDFVATDLFVDDAPHRNQTANLVAGAVTFMCMFRQRVPAAFDPSTFVPPGAGTIDARLITRWTSVIDAIWAELQARSSQVFAGFTDPAATGTSDNVGAANGGQVITTPIDGDPIAEVADSEGNAAGGLLIFNGVTINETADSQGDAAGGLLILNGAAINEIADSEGNAVGGTLGGTAAGIADSIGTADGGQVLIDGAPVNAIADSAGNANGGAVTIDGAPINEIADSEGIAANGVLITNAFGVSDSIGNAANGLLILNGVTINEITDSVGATINGIVTIGGDPVNTIADSVGNAVDGLVIVPTGASGISDSIGLASGGSVGVPTGNIRSVDLSVTELRPTVRSIGSF